LLLVLFPASAWSKPRPYTLEVTPIEGPVDQQVLARYTPALNACKDKAAITNDIALCYKAEFARQDAGLNAAWAKTLARVAPVDRPGLRAAQRAWVKARDPFCTGVMKGFEGGTMAGLEWWDCRAELSIRRTIWLERIR
jgi:uncharacterized protein YecT (DUF1311 family)